MKSHLIGGSWPGSRRVRRPIPTQPSRLRWLLRKLCWWID